MVPCLDGGLVPGDQPIDRSIHQSAHKSAHQSARQSSPQFHHQIGAVQSWLEQRLASLESVGAFEEAYALRMEMADWLLAEAG
jgi:hypothetical protein